MPVTVQEDGGHAITLTTTGLVLGTSYTGFVFDGIDERPLYSGIQGQGRTLLATATTSIDVVTPPLPPGGDYDVRLYVGAVLTKTITGAIKVANRSFGSKLFEVRQLFTDRYAVGEHTPDLVDPIPRLPFFAAIADQAFDAGGSATITPTVTDVDSTIKFFAVVGSLPDGLEIAEDTGIITGTPTTSGTETIQIRAHLNGGGYVESETFDVVINESVIFVGGDSFLVSGEALHVATLDSGVTVESEDQSRGCHAWVGAFNVPTRTFEWAFRCASRKSATDQTGMRLMSVVPAADGSFAIFLTIAQRDRSEGADVAVKLWSRTDQVTPAATFTPNGAAGGGAEQGFVVKYNAAGVFQWVRNVKHSSGALSGSGGGPRMFSCEMVRLGNGNLGISGSVFHFNGTVDTVSFGDPVAPSYAVLFTIANTVSNGSDALLTEIDYATGAHVQTKHFTKTTSTGAVGASAYVTAITRKCGPDGEVAAFFFVTNGDFGTASTRIAEGTAAEKDVSIPQFTSQGGGTLYFDGDLDAQWTAVDLAGDNDVSRRGWSSALAIDDAGALYNAGYFGPGVAGGNLTAHSAGWIAPSTTAPNPTSGSVTPCFITKRNAAGVVQWMRSIGPSSTARVPTGSGQPTGAVALLVANGFLYAAGRIEAGVLILDEGLGSEVQMTLPNANPSTNNNMCWIAKLDLATGHVVDFARTNFNLYPNTVNGGNDNYQLHLEALGSKIIFGIDGANNQVRFEPGGPGDVTLAAPDNGGTIGVIAVYDEDLVLQGARKLVTTVGASNGTFLFLRSLGAKAAA